MSKINYPENALAEMWQNFDWKKIEKKLLKLQQNLTKSVFKRQKNEIKKFQNTILNSLEIRALAVHKISELSTAGAGVDGVLWVTSAEKMRGAISLSDKNYQAQPLKRIVIHDKHKNKSRHIGVPTVKDRAMQILYSFALDPIAEAQADRKSFAFRKGRSTMDAHYFICKALSQKTAPEWVFVGDIKSCYGSISHDWLFQNIPIDRQILSEFLKSGYVFKNQIFPTERGISLGSNISPILGNMVLDGLQNVLFSLQKGRKNIDYDDGNLVRFADDIWVSARSKESAERMKEKIQEFLGERGLVLNEQKSKIIHVSQGFDFLARHYTKCGKILETSPSEKAVKAFESDICAYILNRNANWSQRGLIEGLNSKLRGWAGYHRITSAHHVFRHLDSVISATILQLTQRLYPTKTKDQLIEKYWYSGHDGTKFFALPNKKNLHVMHLRDVILTDHAPLKTSANPYLEPEYFENRTKKHDITKINEKYRAIWLRQHGTCYYCGAPIEKNQPRKLVCKRLCGPKSLDNLAYIHNSCEDDEVIFCHADIENPSEIDVFEIVKEITDVDAQNKKYKKRVYVNLENYFYNCLKTQIVLKFSDIEEIIGHKLCDSAYKYTACWYKKGTGTMSDSWQKNGFAISRLDMKNRRVTFKKIDTHVTKLKIPDVLLSDDIPNDAKYELEKFFDYIRKKYGL